MIQCLGALVLVVLSQAKAGEGPANLVRDVAGMAAAVSVDSSFLHYDSAVLRDGKWIEEGKETTQEFAHRDRLGNGGNTWVSAETETEHWIRLDWPRPMRINEVEIWWSLAEWHPRAFRIEQYRDGRWLPLPDGERWFAASGRRSVVPLPAAEVRSLRIVQPPGGWGARSLMAAQEVLAFHRADGPRARSGARELSAAQMRRLQSRGLARDIARLDPPGAALPSLWTSEGKVSVVEELADGDCRAPVRPEGRVEGFGVSWPIGHVIDGMAVVFAGDVPAPAALVPEVHDGRQWICVRQGLRAERQADRGRVQFSFEPLATRAARVRLRDPAAPQAVAEIEVHRYLPPRKDVWPGHLVEKGGLRDRLLAAPEEPSFEALALAALPMTPARALLGLKDATGEVGIAWDGTAIGRDTLQFRFGAQQESLADGRETVRRRLIDGWRPGTVVEGRLGALGVRQTAFVGLAGDDPGKPALFLRVEVKNLGERPVQVPVVAEAPGQGPPARFHEGTIVRDGRVVLLSRGPSRAADEGRSLQVDLLLEPGGERQADFVAPPAPPGANLAPLRNASFDEALGRFREFWDRALAPAATIDVPEARIHRMVRAVLAQVFVNADGDVMPYGAAPSVYEGNLFGIEESYAILALARFGFGAEAQRYLDGTYLTRPFLKKVEVYKTYADRHQQYRNGLQPHYAASLYRLTRDAGWIRKHLPLLKECAEWTIAQRKRTMEPANGRKPLHWGLLPAWSYGGDIAEVQCHALYANYCCWRGLTDTAWLLEDLGDPQAARRYRDEAKDYRAAIDRAVEGSYQAGRRPPFLPLRLYADRPDEQMDYYQLFAGCILDLAPFEKGNRHYRWIADFLEGDNRMFCLLPRFRRDAGPGGLDALYGKGYLLSQLREDRVKEFLLGFYAYLAFNLDHETFASRETNVLYASDLHVRSAYHVPDMSDPVPCSSAVALELLRHMLVREERAGPEDGCGSLHLLSAAPRDWLRDGRKIRLSNWPTDFGPVSLEARSAAASGRIEFDLAGPHRNPCRAMKLRVRHPEARPMKSVTVDKMPWNDFDPHGECISLPARKQPYRIAVGY